MSSVANDVGNPSSFESRCTRYVFDHVRIIMISSTVIIAAEPMLVANVGLS